MGGEPERAGEGDEDELGLAAGEDDSGGGFPADCAGERCGMLTPDSPGVRGSRQLTLLAAPASAAGDRALRTLVAAKVQAKARQQLQASSLRGRPCEKEHATGFEPRALAAAKARGKARQQLQASS